MKHRHKRNKNLSISHRVIFLLGSNQMNRLGNLILGLTNLRKISINKKVEFSSIYTTQAWGGVEQTDYLNMVCAVRTKLPPLQILNYCQKIEYHANRKREIKWGARTLDIDILFLGDEIIQKDRLVVPHPLLEQRKFALVPLVEMYPKYKHPKLHKTMLHLLDNCQDKSKVIPTIEIKHAAI